MAIICLSLIFNVSLCCASIKNVHGFKKYIYKNELRLSLPRKQQSLETLTPMIQPSAHPSTYPSTYPSERPSSTQAPTLNPSVSSLPTVQSSASPTKIRSSNPSTIPSLIPTNSTFPSLVPSIAPSVVPTTTPTIYISSSPSYTLKNGEIHDLEMTFEGMDTEFESSIAQDNWRNITSHHVLQYWKEKQIENMSIKTYIVRQDILYIQQNMGLRRKMGTKSFVENRNHGRKTNTIKGKLKVIYFQEFELRNGSSSSSLSLAPFANLSDKQDYIIALKSSNDIFSTVSNVTVRLVNTDMPSMVPTSNPTLAKITNAPSNEPTRIEPIVQHNEAVIALSSILVCLIVLMICTAIWFIFVHNRNDMNNRYSDTFSKKRNNPEANDNMIAQSTNSELGFLFPIKSDESLNENLDDNIEIVYDQKNNLSQSHEESQSIVSVLISEESSGHSRSDHSGTSIEYAEASNMSSLLVAEDQTQEEIRNSSGPTVGPTKIMAGAGDFSNIHLLRISDIDDIDFNDR